MSNQEPVNLFIRLDVAAEAKDQLKLKLFDNTIESRKELGCRSFDMFAAEACDENQLYLFERWDSQGSLDQHMTQPHYFAVRGLLKNPDLVKASVKRLQERFAQKTAPTSHRFDRREMRVVIVVLEVDPNDTQGLLDAMAESIPQARNADGNISFQLYQGIQSEYADESNTFVLFEKWATPAAHQDHLESDYTVKLHDYMIPKLTRPLNEQRYLLKDIAIEPI